MSDEHLIRGLRALDRPVDVDPAFGEALYAILEGEYARRHQVRPRITLLLVAALLVALVVGGAVAVGSGLVRLTISDAWITRPSPGAEALANDEPCTRTVPMDARLAPVPFHHEDLERMVLDRGEIAGLEGLELDLFRQGYHDNAELTFLEVNPPSTCDDLIRFGRIEGYGSGYTDFAGHGVLFAVHLFWDDAGAQGWMDAFIAGLEASVGTPAGPQSFRILPRSSTAPDTTLVEHVGGDGTRTWALFRRGPIVGWVVDLHPEDTATIDVPLAAGRMAGRVETVIAEAAARDRSGLDVAQLLSAPLPLAEYGPRGNGLAWDSFFGGCQDAIERGQIAGPQAEADARRLGRITGCTAMYAGAHAAPVVRVFSSVNVYRDAAGASESLTASLAELVTRGGVRFTVAGVGDEAIGLVTPPGEDAAHTDTRVVMRLGELTASVVFQEKDGDATGDILALARRLEDRIRALQAAGG
jgi:hypothetical protein